MTFSLEEAGVFFANSIFKESLKGNNFSVLYDFMNQFDKVEDYCKLFYNIDDKLVESMIKSGEKEITNIQNLFNYIELVKVIGIIRLLKRK